MVLNGKGLLTDCDLHGDSLGGYMVLNGKGLLTDCDLHGYSLGVAIWC